MEAQLIRLHNKNPHTLSLWLEWQFSSPRRSGLPSLLIPNTINSLKKLLLHISYLESSDGGCTSVCWLIFNIRNSLSLKYLSPFLSKIINLTVKLFHIYLTNLWAIKIQLYPFRDLKFGVEVGIFSLCMFGLNIEPEALLRKLSTFNKLYAWLSWSCTAKENKYSS
jgi:hypothetical protein